ncbi:SUKH-4 family immunity protein [Kitasatospora sp. NA04385]|uniref:SUKH-4 family immunity protein n=1 Tax=Kitasatospora sp. NA04385 TaxID=2742135 RepID=UPI0015926842|nr:SUKH-4 family immunity protein [Kitasatospora sp. NA04385]QKW23357.1 SUKH-4 family immunity protein [Kitasatospora sp. NA04385]
MTTGPEPTPRPDRSFLPAELPALIEDPLFLAQVDRTRLLAGMAECWPDGVPAGTLAEDVHHLDRLGVRPPAERHGEWLSWLHLLLVSHGRADDAAVLADAGYRLPWRTVWSRWVPPGARAARPTGGGRVVALRVVEHEDAPVVSVHEQYVLARLDRMEPDDEDGYYEYAVDLADGAVLAGPQLFRPFEADDLPDPYEPVLPEDLPELGEAVLNGPDGWDDETAGLPAAPEQVEHAVRVDRLAVFGGGWGCYAVELHTGGDPDESEGGDEDRDEDTDGDGNEGAATGPFVDGSAPAVTALAPAGLPPEAREPDREWLARYYGADALWTSDPADLPAGLRHEPTRRFLTEVGFPAVRHPLLDFSSETLAEKGLSELRTADLHSPEDPDFAGLGEHAYLIATDNDGLTLITVDGESGRVSRYSTERWEGDYYGGVMASSVERFAALLRLYATYYRGADEAALADSGRQLRDWALELDPVVARSDFWTEVFQDREDFV